MTTYLAFLRGINVGGHKKIKMADLRTSLAKQRFKNVRTYIQSGNIVLDNDKNAKEVAAMIKETIQKDFGFDVPTLVLTQNVVIEILGNCPFQPDTDQKNLYFALLDRPPEKDNYGKLNSHDYPNEEFVITENCVYLNYKIGAGKGKLSNNIIEKKLGVVATTRNLRTLQKMIELSS